MSIFKYMFVYNFKRTSINQIWLEKS